MKANHVIAVALAFTLAWVATGYAQQTAEELYQAGLYQEDVQGNLESAIDIYRRILDEFSGNRTVGAKAQLHIGLCYEKLGWQEAQQAYRRVIADFPEHADEVAVARDRLASLERALAELNRQPSFRRIEIASKPQSGVLSPDGNKLAFISDGGVWVVPLHGKVDPDIAGEPVRIAEVPGAWDDGSLMAWSADGEWIAVNSMGDDEVPVYVIPATGGEPREVEMPDRGGHPWSYRLSLYPDGQKLAFSALELGTHQEAQESHARYIYSMPTVGGEPARISSSWGVLPSFSPDGELIAFVGYRERDDWPENAKRWRYDGDLWIASSTGSNPVRLATVDGRLRGPIWSPDGKYIAAHHEPGTDNSSKEIWVFPLSPDASSVAEPTKIALPRESWHMVSGWTPDGELGVFIQSESHQAIYTVPASGGKAVQVSADRYAWYPRWSPDGERIYARAFRDEATHITVGYVPSAGGELVEIPVRAERTLVSRVPGGGFNLSPDGEQLVVSAYQAPYDPEEGVDVWAIPLDGGRPTRLTSDGSMEGYPCWSPDGKWIAFTDGYELTEEEGVNAIFLVLAEGGEIRQLTVESDSVGGGAIAFSPDGERIAFLSSGTIKTIPVQGGESEVLIPAPETGWRSHLAWSPNGKKIAYSAGGMIWITPLDGGEPQELRTGLPEDAKLGDFSWSPDGERIAFVASIGGDAEFWLISDFLPSDEGR
jgi:Tol biopolymer transport system component